MRHIIFFLLTLFGIIFTSCNTPTELSVPDSSKEADKFARQFIGYILNGQADSCFSKIQPSVLNDNLRTYIENGIKNIKGAELINVKVVGFYYTAGKFYKAGDFTIYKLGYEYQFDKVYIVFRTDIEEKDGKMLLTSFNGTVLQVPLSQLTSFTLANKGFMQYLILFLALIVPLFILVSFITMLLSKIPVKKKLLWAFIILFLTVIRFSINWNTGELGFQLLNFNFLLGFVFSKPDLMSAWSVGFNLPIGAILFWINRKRLVTPEWQPNIPENIVNTNEIGLKDQ